MLAMIFVMILYEVLHKAIGRNLEKEEGLLSLGIKTKKEYLVAPPSFYFLFMQFIILHILAFMMCWQHLNNLAVNPFGLGALYGSISWMTTKISLSNIFFMSKMLVSWLIRDGMRVSNFLVGSSSLDPSSEYRLLKCSDVSSLISSWDVFGCPYTPTTLVT